MAGLCDTRFDGGSGVGGLSHNFWRKSRMKKGSGGKKEKAPSKGPIYVTLLVGSGMAQDSHQGYRGRRQPTLPSYKSPRTQLEPVKGCAHPAESDAWRAASSLRGAGAVLVCACVCVHDCMCAYCTNMLVCPHLCWHVYVLACICLFNTCVGWYICLCHTLAYMSCVIVVG